MKFERSDKIRERDRRTDKKWRSDFPEAHNRTGFFDSQYLNQVD